MNIHEIRRPEILLPGIDAVVYDIDDTLVAPLDKAFYAQYEE